LDGGLTTIGELGLEVGVGALVGRSCDRWWLLFLLFEPFEALPLDRELFLPDSVVEKRSVLFECFRDAFVLLLFVPLIFELFL
jgi:hypothetical protein